tara:strand:+ start:12443 stop:13156 length:714 start_codon:yes stop_codon:yes gene_type:complete
MPIEYLKWRNHHVKIERKRFYRRIAVYVEPNESLRLKSAVLTRKTQLLDFLDQHATWIERQVATFQQMKRQYPQPQYEFGEKFPLLGRWVQVLPTEKKHFYLQEDKLFLPIRQNFKQELLKAYKKMAEDYLPLRVAKWERRMALKARSIKVRRYKSRWGSCSFERDISLNMKLVAAPTQVLDYVIVHELCHICHMNHSKAFWSLVAKHCEDYKISRNWLKKNHLYFDFLAKESELYS